jgi:hypothetical protein
MQLGRSYSRRLKSVKNEIYELFPSARHAYNTIRPAVKTSRPHTPALDAGSHDCFYNHECIFFKDHYYGVPSFTLRLHFDKLGVTSSGYIRAGYPLQSALQYFHFYP